MMIRISFVLRYSYFYVALLAIAFHFSSICAAGQNSISLQCLNPFPEGSVVLVTDIDNPILVQCLMSQEYDNEKLVFKWKVSSGTIAARNDICEWFDPFPGLQTVSVSVFSEFNKPNAKPIITAEKTFLVPHQINTEESDSYNGFTIGEYPNPNDESDLAQVDEASQARLQKYASSFKPPTLFYEVNPDTYSINIFGEYTLGEFDLDPRFTPLEYPRYIAIHPHLIEKINRLESFLHTKGLQFQKVHIIYGYRSPAYNTSSRREDQDKSLKEPFSLHLYGKAIDFIIDENNDMVMDDINQDGKISFEDGIQLAQYIAEFDMSLLEENSPLVGGVGLYYHHDYWERGEYAQSPYIHIDVRGYAREDGKIIHWIGKDVINVKEKADPYPTPKAIPRFPMR